MIKRFPSRNSRSKGIKVKHVLQICLLVGICFWLIYQVKHSHDKKKEFDEKDAKVAVTGQGANPTPKYFGRKDLHPRVDDVAKNDKAGEDEDDEAVVEEEVISGGEDIKHAEEVEQEHEVTKHEDEEREDISKQEDEEMEEDETKHEEVEKKADDTEEEGRGAGDDEIDEHDHDKLEGETIEEDAIDDEKEKADEDNEKEGQVNKDDGKEGDVEDETLLKDVDHDHDDGSQNTHDHEAREEHYRADDASSAVTHDAQTTESGNGTIDVQEDEIANNNATANLNAGQTNLTAQLEQSDMAANSSSDGELKDEKISLPTENKSTDNTTSTMVPDDHQQKTNESAAVNPETRNNSTEETSLLASVVSNSTYVQNATTGGDSATNETTSEPERVNDDSVSGKDESIISEAGDGEASNSTSNSESAKAEFSNSDENHVEVTHDPIDSSDSSVAQEENSAGLGNQNVAAE
ncbi:hypothetical protein LINGRAHAP2_LOCUS32321 [Linum grandiflorum]